MPEEGKSATGREWAEVATSDAVPPGSMHQVRIGRLEIVLANVDGTVYALEDMCTHQDYPLSDGDLEGTEVECTLHGAKFDVCTGEATQLPAIKAVRTFDVENRDGSIYVAID